MMGERSLIRRTGQLWKLRLSFWWLPIIGLVTTVAAAFDVVGRTAEEGAVLILGGLALVVASYVWGVGTIRCPRCRTRLLWRAMRDKTPGEWLGWLLALEVCPTCGNSGSTTGIGLPRE